MRATIERLMALLVPALTIDLGPVIAAIIGAVLMAILSATSCRFSPRPDAPPLVPRLDAPLHARRPSCRDDQRH